MKFTEQLWKEIQPIYDEIITHPFNQELSQGTLAKEKFIFYMQQDALYLNDFARALSLASAKSESPEWVTQFAEFAQGAILAEKSLHDAYFDLFEITPTDYKSPTCTNYTSFLLATVSLKSFEEGVAALLPCFLIYEQVGKHIHNISPGGEENESENPYQKWIDTYADEDFEASVKKAIEITDIIGNKSDEKTKEAMRLAFIRSTQLEWMFWDSAYHLEEWPVAISNE